MSTTLLEGHVLAVLEGLPAGHFHTCVTSPPYWQLRAYGTEPQVWGGAEGCAHDWGEVERHIGPGKRGDTKVRWNHTGQGQSGHEYREGAFCSRCGAWRGELGQEPTPELFVDHLVAVFEAVRRVLRDDGTLWVNLAGSYWSEPGGQNSAQGGVSPKAREANHQNGRHRLARHPVYKGLDWVDVPGRFAHAMQAAGWVWRSDVVWVKPSALPESVQGTRWERCRTKTAKGTRGDLYAEEAYRQEGWIPQSGARGPKGDFGAPYDAEWADCPGCPKCAQTDGLVLRRGSGRPTKATERVLLFAKRAGYFFDQEAVREANSEGAIERFGADPRISPTAKYADAEAFSSGGKSHEWRANGRNLRDWWVIGPEPLKDAHYAAYPSELPSRCIKAGTSEWGCCPACGSPWARVVSRAENPYPGSSHDHSADRERGGTQTHASGIPAGTIMAKRWYEKGPDTTLGWRPTCPCPEQPPVPCRVLDPFSGAGTTLLAANRLGRDATGVELQPQYAALARKRVGREPLSLFATHGDTGGILPVQEVEGALVDG